MSFLNIPKVKLGLVAVSRDCFPITLSQARRKSVIKACTNSGVEIFEAQTIIENEIDALKAFEEIKAAGVNALVVYLGNFGPEGPETLLIQKFAGPSMVVAASEESMNNLMNARGDAYCGMLNASYNLGLKNLKAYIPEYPVGTPAEIVGMIKDFSDISRVLIGITNLKIMSFGPRPFDFLACNAPIKPLFDLGVNIQENSELDLFASYNAHENDSRIPSIIKDMEEELGSEGNGFPGILPKLAQYEATLIDWFEKNKGASDYGVFANKCWPSFQTQFGFVPCYVNSRFTGRGIPIACETDIYGALSEYIITCITQSPATLLDINNTVPNDMYEANKKTVAAGYKENDLFMGFHCGNTCSSCMGSCKVKFQKIMHSLLEPDKEPNITRGTLEGTIKPGDITLFRLQSTADAKLTSYISQGEVLDIDPMSFGGIGVFAVKEMSRFYRHVLIAKRYPHHAGVAFAHCGKILFEAMKLLGVEDVAYNQPASALYKDENPFA